MQSIFRSLGVCRPCGGCAQVNPSNYCGDGTIFQDGKCQVDQTRVECGPGTHLVNGICTIKFTEALESSNNMCHAPFATGMSSTYDLEDYVERNDAVPTSIGVSWKNAQCHMELYRKWQCEDLNQQEACDLMNNHQ